MIETGVPMVLIPLMWYLFDESWPTSGATVFMTPTKVWGPLGIAPPIFLAFGGWWTIVFLVMFVGYLAFKKWEHPHAFDKIFNKEGGDYING